MFQSSKSYLDCVLRFVGLYDDTKYNASFALLRLISNVFKYDEVW
jgi:hypothetical protein